MVIESRNVKRNSDVNVSDSSGERANVVVHEVIRVRYRLSG